jgi:transcriptional antiterminator RfaH
MLKLSDNPPVVPVGVDPFTAPGKWWVAHTRSRCEKALAWDLIEKNIAYFLPMVDRISISGGKKRRARIPLFSSHVFMKGLVDVRAAALATGRACRVIEVLDQGTFTEELTAVQRALNSGIRVDPYDHPQGVDPCRITSGPLANIKCSIVRSDRLATIVLPLTLLRRGVLLQIDPGLLEKLPMPPVAREGRADQPSHLRFGPNGAPLISPLDLHRMRMNKTFAGT